MTIITHGEEEMIQKWVSNRIKERTTYDGVVLIVAGVCFVMFQPLATIAAYAAIVYGAYTLIKSEK